MGKHVCCVLVCRQLCLIPLGFMGDKRPVADADRWHYNSLVTSVAWLRHCPFCTVSCVNIIMDERLLLDVISIRRLNAWRYRTNVLVDQFIHKYIHNMQVKLEMHIQHLLYGRPNKQSFNQGCLWVDTSSIYYYTLMDGYALADISTLWLIQSNTIQCYYRKQMLLIVDTCSNM